MRCSRGEDIAQRVAEAAHLCGGGHLPGFQQRDVVEHTQPDTELVFIRRIIDQLRHHRVMAVEEQLLRT